ncbi:MAG: hypothetical protein CMH98_19050 [Oceanospirillaceae bacterium]|nr:hypothetical protein [Oceanospirillaceae bacterium]
MKHAKCSQCGQAREDQELNGVDPLADSAEEKYQHAYCRHIADCNSAEAEEQISDLADDLAGETAPCKTSQNTRPIWVVRLHRDRKINGKRQTESETKIVRASTKQKALITAKNNCYMGGKIYGTARLAHPTLDLGCIHISKLESHWEQMRNQIRK